MYINTIQCIAKFNIRNTLLIHKLKYKLTGLTNRSVFAFNRPVDFHVVPEVVVTTCRLRNECVT